MSRYRPHLEAAHAIWSKVVQKGDIVIDATCGNGHDTLILAKLALTEHSGIVYAMDLQEIAISQTKHNLQQHLPNILFQRIQFYHGCHSNFPINLAAQSAKLIVYNLGYLPGSDKTVTTCTHTTIQSISHALNFLCKDGLLSITCYPGHLEGKKEEEALIKFASSLDKITWNVHHHRWGAPHSPSLLLIQRI